MKAKFTFIIFFIFVLVSVISVLAFYKASYDAAHFLCIANSVETNRDTTINAVYHLSMDGDNGVLIVDGRLIKNKSDTKIDAIFKNRVLFKIDRSHHSFFLHSTDVYLQSTQVKKSDLEGVWPSFLIEKGNVLLLLIYQQNNDALILYKGNMPFLYCNIE